MRLPNLNSLRRAKSEIGYRSASGIVKRALHTHIKKYSKLKDYPKIEEAHANLCKAIDSRNKEDYEYWLGQLQYYTKVKPETEKEEKKKLKDVEKSQGRMKDKLARELEKRTGMKI